MLVINYNGNKPITDYFKYSVQGNNQADTIRFVISLNQSGLVFNEDYHYYAKVQSVDNDYYDKVRLTNVEFDTEHNLLKADFVLKAQQTANKQIEVALSCENLNEEIVWQTQLVKITIANGVNADEQIADQYPSVLQNLQEQIDELWEQGGGGGESVGLDVAIKRVYLTHTNKCSLRYDIIATDLHGKLDERFTNDSTSIFVNFETTPINSRLEHEIEQGHFIIRLDYPIRSNSHNNIGSFDTAFSYQKAVDTHTKGVGSRSFALSFIQQRFTPKKKTILLNSLIFITPNDVKTNRYGEKYIHKKISLYDLTTKVCEFNALPYPLTLETLEDDNWFYALEDKLMLGIPSVNYHGSWNTENLVKLFSGTLTNKFYINKTDFNGDNQNHNRFNHGKLDPAFNTYFMLYYPYDNQMPTLYSPYFISQRIVRGKHPTYTFRVCGSVKGGMAIVDKNGDSNAKASRFAYMSLKPRCAVVNDNYASSGTPFVKVFSQSDQQIRLACRYMYNLNIDGKRYIAPMIRTLITRK